MTNKPTIDGVSRYEFRPSQYARQFIDLDMPTGKYVSAENYDAAQATIAQLEQRIAELERGRGEPVAWVHPAYLKSTFLGIDATHTQIAQAQIPLYAEQRAPVAVVLPEWKFEITHNTHDWDEGYADGWAAYKTELKRLNPSL